MLLDLVRIGDQIVIILQHGHGSIALAAQAVLNGNDFILIDGVKDRLADILVVGDMVLIQVELHLDEAVDQRGDQAEIGVAFHHLYLVGGDVVGHIDLTAAQRGDGSILIRNILQGDVLDDAAVVLVLADAGVGLQLHLVVVLGAGDVVAGDRQVVVEVSAFFNVLSKKTQDDIIGRTEQTL